MNAPVALITGGAVRIGQAICRALHTDGYRVLIHCLRSTAAAKQLADELNTARPDSAAVLQADLNDSTAAQLLAAQAQAQWGRLDALINSASRFYPTPLGHIDSAQIADLFASNAFAPLLLAQAAAPSLKLHRGVIVNIADIYGERPLRDHSVYSMAKAANRMLTLSLALELAPEIRVNGIAPGAILWPESGGAADNAQQQALLAKVPLAQTGSPQAIADTVRYLLSANYVTGQIVSVDGGRLLHL